MEDMEGIATVSVPKSKALHSSGAKKGRLRKGCRFSGRGARCTPDVAKRLGIRASGGKRKRKAKNGRRRGRGPMHLTPKSPQALANKRLFMALQERRRAFAASLRSGNCSHARNYARELVRVLGAMSRLPSDSPMRRMKRNKRYNTEQANVVLKANYVCKHPGSVTTARTMMISGMGKKSKPGGHPCASPKPPAWCNKKRKR